MRLAVRAYQLLITSYYLSKSGLHLHWLLINFKVDASFKTID